MVFEGWAEAGDVDGAEVVDEIRAVRIAHAADAWVAGQRQYERVVCLGQGNRCPVEQRQAHVDGDQSAWRAFAGEQPTLGAQRDRFATGLAHQSVGGATGCAAADIQHGAVGVPELQARIGIIAVEHHGELVEADA